MRENLSTYVVQDKKKKKDELTRLIIQDQMITAAMGGVLAEQADPTVFRHVLDVACGTGGWLITAAQTYPTIEKLVGVDISQQMIKYAQTQAETNQVNDRVEFYVMDALQPLDFSAASFDLVNLRYGISFLRTWDWREMMRQLQRVTRPGGVIRVTDAEVIHQSNSPALTELFEMLLCAFFQSGRLFTQESTGLNSQLAALLHQYGCQQVQTRAYKIEYRAGTAKGEAFREDILFAFRTLRPFIEKWGCIVKDYGAIYQQALKETRQPDFLAVGNLLTVWGSKPDTPQSSHRALEAFTDKARG